MSIWNHVTDVLPNGPEYVKIKRGHGIESVGLYHSDRYSWLKSGKSLRWWDRDTKRPINDVTQWSDLNDKLDSKNDTPKKSKSKSKKS